MAFRILRYVVKIWDHWLQKNSQAKRLPAVVPLVLHTGGEKWDAPIEVLDLIDLDAVSKEVAAHFLPRMKFLLDDLAEASEEDLIKRQELSAMARMTQALMSLLSIDEPLAFLHRWGKVLLEIENDTQGLDNLKAVVYYIDRRIDARFRPEVFDFMRQQLGEKGREVAFSIADSYVAEGMAKGMAKGKAEGIAEGMAEGMTEGIAQALTLILQQRFGTLPSKFSKLIEAADLPQLREWLVQAVAAPSLDDLFLNKNLEH